MNETLAEIGNESELAVLGYMAVDVAHYQAHDIPPLAAAIQFPGVGNMGPAELPGAHEAPQ